jgi:hypothetical protein
VTDQKVFRDQRGKKRSTIPNVMRKPQSRCKRTNRSVFIPCLEEVKGIQYVEASENQSLSCVFHW